MEVFISWSGPRSQAVARALHTWLPQVINALKPWLSSTDIEKGARWSQDVSSRLNSAKAGIICLTPSNLSSPWIQFEAGALSKSVDVSYVCTLLVGLEPSDVAHPLAQFQATKAEKDDIFNLLKTLNQALGDGGLTEEHLKEAFAVWWPKLEQKLSNLPKDELAKSPTRTDRQILEEILAVVRDQSRSQSQQPTGQRVAERAIKHLFNKYPKLVHSVTTQHTPFEVKVAGRDKAPFLTISLEGITEESLEDHLDMAMRRFLTDDK